MRTITAAWIMLGLAFLIIFGMHYTRRAYFNISGPVTLKIGLDLSIDVARHRSKLTTKGRFISIDVWPSSSVDTEYVAGALNCSVLTGDGLWVTADPQSGQVGGAAQFYFNASDLSSGVQKITLKSNHSSLIRIEEVFYNDRHFY